MGDEPPPEGEEAGLPALTKEAIGSSLSLPGCPAKFVVALAPTHPLERLAALRGERVHHAGSGRPHARCGVHEAAGAEELVHDAAHVAVAARFRISGLTPLSLPRVIASVSCGRIAHGCQDRPEHGAQGSGLI